MSLVGLFEKIAVGVRHSGFPLATAAFPAAGPGPRSASVLLARSLAAHLVAIVLEHRLVVKVPRHFVSPESLPHVDCLAKIVVALARGADDLVTSLPPPTRAG